nr:MAG TPA: hypothetical protein [Caudoviricetes sp.]
MFVHILSTLLVYFIFNFFIENFHFYFLLKIKSYICEITSLFYAGREGTDKSEGLPPGAVSCIWAVCYNVAANGEQPPSGLLYRSKL